MIISHSKKFILFSPWKTASSTTNTRLKSHNQSPYSNFFHFNKNLNRIVHQHMICADFMSLPERKLKYLLGSFVRNPYDKVYSGFQQLQKDLKNQPSFEYESPWVMNHVMRQLSENSAQLRQAQYDFDGWVTLLTEEQIYEAGRNSNFPLHPAHYWTHIADKKLVSFIGRVESFEDDFKNFLDLVNIEPLKKENANIDDLKGNSDSNPEGYRYIDRMSRHSIDKINYLFKRDFELFDYNRI